MHASLTLTLCAIQKQSLSIHAISIPTCAFRCDFDFVWKLWLRILCHTKYTQYTLTSLCAIQKQCVMAFNISLSLSLSICTQYTNMGTHM